MAGISKEAKTPMIATTTSSSIRVKPNWILLTSLIFVPDSIVLERKAK
jgi:hypothetical protein